MSCSAQTSVGTNWRDALPPLPTLGGKQFYRDVFIHTGWRIQCNVRTGKYRLLDPSNRSCVSGDYQRCKSCFDHLRISSAIAPRSDHLVLMLHGIARSIGTFRSLKRTLIDKGYDAAAVSYPSTRGTVEAHADGMATILDRLEATKTVSFVTHSLGGLILRVLLTQDAAWRYRLNIGRIVMIAPPNQGSAIARALKNNPLYCNFYGPAGQQLVPETAALLPCLETQEIAIIAGGTGGETGYNPFLRGDNDGTVTVAETQLEGAQNSIVLPAIHARISNAHRTVQAVTAFLDTGALPNSTHENGGHHA